MGAIRKAGFQEIRILDETVFPTEVLANDPTAREIVKNLNLSPQKAKELAQSVVSVKVSALKPAVLKKGGENLRQKGSPIGPLPDLLQPGRGEPLEMDTLISASSVDEPWIRQLLTLCGLPHEDITPEHLPHFWVIKEKGEILGTVGIGNAWPIGASSLLGG